MMKIIYTIGLIVLALVVVVLLRNSSEPESPYPEAFQPRSQKVPQLQDCAEADTALREVMRYILENREEKHHRGGVRASEIESLSSITHEHPGTKSAMRAKFLIGTIYSLEGTRDEVAKGKFYLKAIIQEHPDTFVSKFADYTLQTLAFLKFEDQEETRQRQNARSRKALKELLPYASQMDQDSSDFATFLRKILTGEKDRDITPGLLYDLSMSFDWDGKIEEAKRVLKQIVKEYPDTHWSEKAKRDLKSINASGNGH